MKTRESIFPGATWTKIQDEEGFVYITSGSCYLAFTEKKSDGSSDAPDDGVTGMFWSATNNRILNVPTGEALYAKTTVPGNICEIVPNY